MRLLILMILVVVLPNIGKSQNLVPNWSFDEHYSCPNTGGQINKSKHWFTPRGGGGSTELLDSCNNSDPFSPGLYGVPSNNFGYQFGINDYSYSGIATYVNNQSNYKEYIEVRLTQSLNSNINYYVELWVSLANKSAFAIENIGASLSKDTLHYFPNPSALMNISAQIEYSNGIILDTINWIKVSGYFKPDEDGYQFLTIGNFNSNSTTNFQYLGGIGGAYYYVDNVVVIDSALQHTINVNSLELKGVNFDIYPNPAQGSFLIKLDGLYKQEIEVSVFDLYGRTLLIERRKTNESLNFNKVNLPSGTYIIRVSDSKGIIGNRKLIVL